jgi:hypothetical protein
MEQKMNIEAYESELKLKNDQIKEYNDEIV